MAKNPRAILLDHIHTLLHGAGYTVRYKDNEAGPEQDTLVVGRGADVFTVRVFHVPPPDSAPQPFRRAGLRPPPPTSTA